MIFFVSGAWKWPVLWRRGVSCLITCNTDFIVFSWIRVRLTMTLCVCVCVTEQRWSCLHPTTTWPTTRPSGAPRPIWSSVVAEPAAYDRDSASTCAVVLALTGHCLHHFAQIKHRSSSLPIVSVTAWMELKMHATLDKYTQQLRGHLDFMPSRLHSKSTRGQQNQIAELLTVEVWPICSQHSVRNELLLLQSQLHMEVGSKKMLLFYQWWPVMLAI